MAWARLDDQLDDHDKFLQLSSAAIGQWTLALTYASRKMSDGFISTARAKLQIVGRGEDYDAITGELVTAGLWDVVEGGFQIHDYLDYNPSREQIERGIEQTRERLLARPYRNAIIERDGLICGICGGAVSPDDVDIDHMTPISRGGMSVPSNLRVTHSSCNRSRGNR